jgi:hypothetical protein
MPPPSVPELFAKVLETTASVPELETPPYWLPEMVLDAMLIVPRLRMP